MHNAHQRQWKWAEKRSFLYTNYFEYISHLNKRHTYISSSSEYYPQSHQPFENHLFLSSQEFHSLIFYFFYHCKAGKLVTWNWNDRNILIFDIIRLVCGLEIGCHFRYGAGARKSSVRANSDKRKSQPFCHLFSNPSPNAITLYKKVDI